MKCHVVFFCQMNATNCHTQSGRGQRSLTVLQDNNSVGLQQLHNITVTVGGVQEVRKGKSISKVKATLTVSLDASYLELDLKNNRSPPFITCNPSSLCEALILVKNRTWWVQGFRLSKLRTTISKYLPLSNTRNYLPEKPLKKVFWTLLGQSYVKGVLTWLCPFHCNTSGSEYISYDDNVGIIVEKF